LTNADRPNLRLGVREDEMNMEREPRVSVVTPFYNTAEYLAECIESVLSQTYSNYEYLLVNNKSSDGSREIAARYAAKDARIRLIDNDEFVPQLRNYNGALARIAADSQYVKFAQADDVIFPHCLVRMVELAEREPSVGIVSAYYLFGKHLDGAGVDYRVSVVRGRQACRQMLLERRSLTGSQTTVLYRADLVRSRRPFFRELPYFADTEAAFDILLEQDLGYVHQILSYTRVENESVMSPVRDFDPMLLFFHLATERFGREVLSPEEFAAVRDRVRRDYYKFLGKSWIHRKGHRFWEFQRASLESFDHQLDWSRVIVAGLREVLRMTLNPGTALAQTWRDLGRSG
jgi:glycosyltransferase involved in cell wall biosynthesis